MNVEVGKVARLTFSDGGTQDVLVSAVTPQPIVWNMPSGFMITGRRIVKKTGQPEKGTGEWVAHTAAVTL